MARADRRRSERVEESGQAATTSWSFWPIATEALWWGLMVLIVVLTGRATFHRITWYLAVDQYGYITFATDLLHGKILHDWPVAKALASVLPERTDMLAQTYIWDHGRMYCRYAPGFPIVLAAWLGTFGPMNIHYLNPSLYVAFLGIYVTLAWRLLGDRWRALTALCLLLLLPTYTHLWGLTLTRDLLAHMVAWCGLICMVPRRGKPLTVRRVAVGGLFFGFCGSIRPDDVMYLIPAGLLALHHWRRDETSAAVAGRAIAAGAATVFVGLLPFFLYNWAATGNPLWPTQGEELNMLLRPAHEVQKDTTTKDAPPPPATPPTTAVGTPPKVGYPSPGWHGGQHVQVQGGALRIANLPTTLPGLLDLLNRGYGPAFMGLAVWGIVLALIQRPLLLLAAIPYAVSALLLYGCWSRPDGRYVLGVHYFMPLLIVEGLFGNFDLHRRMMRMPSIGAGTARWVALLGAVAMGALALFAPTPVGYQNSPLPVLTNWMVPPLVGAGLLAAFLLPERRMAGWTALVVAMATSGYVANRMQDVLAKPSAGFQRGEMERARANMQASLPPNAVVMSTEDIGRPMENIDYYSGVAHAVYETDVARWKITPAQLVEQFDKAGLQLYWLTPPFETPQAQNIFKVISVFVQMEKVRDIPKERAMDWFVAAAFHRGIPLQLWKMTPKKLGP